MSKKKSLLVFFSVLVGLGLVMVFIVKNRSISPQDSSSIQELNQNSNSRAGDCIILTDEDCKLGTLFEKELNGKKILIVGFKLKPGSPLYSLYPGFLAKGEYSKGENLKGNFLSITNNDNPKQRIYYAGDIDITQTKSVEVDRGFQIAEIDSKGISNYGEFNLLIVASLIEPDGNPVSDEQTIKSLFGIHDK